MAQDLIESSRRSMEAGSKSFSGAARLLPPEVRASVLMLYAWCRSCDDIIDGQELGYPSGRSRPGSRDAIAELYANTERALAGEPMDSPPFQALQRVVSERNIPHRYPIELIDGFAMDVAGRRYETFDDTLSYCYHVAGVVGIMMAIILGVDDEPTLDRACDLGLAFQLTNIARDVMDDADAGRVYLPEDWLGEAGMNPETLSDPGCRLRVSRVVRRLLDKADLYYDSAMVGVAALPIRSAVSIAAARSIYRAIGDKVISYDVRAWDQRLSISPGEKLRLGLGAGVSLLIAKVGRRPEFDRSGLWTRPHRQRAPMC